MAVFKDIIPGYRIRKQTEKEEKVKLSKDVKRVKEYEETLLSNYQNYLQTLEDVVKGMFSFEQKYLSACSKPKIQTQQR